MEITIREEGDLDLLDALVGGEKDATQRDRLRAVRLVLDGGEAQEIAGMLGRSRRFVQEWAYVYRDGGIEAIKPGKSTGRPPLPRDKEQAFRARVLAGPSQADGGVCTLRGVDAMRILEKEFGVRYSLGVYDLLHRLRLSCLVPRPRHRKNDPQAMPDWTRVYSHTGLQPVYSLLAHGSDQKKARTTLSLGGDYENASVELVEIVSEKKGHLDLPKYTYAVDRHDRVGCVDAWEFNPGVPGDARHASVRVALAPIKLKIRFRVPDGEVAVRCNQGQ